MCKCPMWLWSSLCSRVFACSRTLTHTQTEGLTSVYNECMYISQSSGIRTYIHAQYLYQYMHIKSAEYGYFNKYAQLSYEHLYRMFTLRALRRGDCE